MRAPTQHGGSGCLIYGTQTAAAVRSCPSRNAPGAALSLGLLSSDHGTRLRGHKGVVSRGNAGWNVEMTPAVHAAAGQEHFANFGANTPYPFPFIVPLPQMNILFKQAIAALINPLEPIKTKAHIPAAEGALQRCSHLLGGHCSSRASCSSIILADVMVLNHKQRLGHR